MRKISISRNLLRQPATNYHESLDNCSQTNGCDLTKISNYKRRKISSLKLSTAFIVGASLIVSLFSVLPRVEGQQQGNSSSILFTVRSSFDPLTGALFYNKIDSNGFTVQSANEFFPTPPIAVCENNTSWQQFQKILLNNQIQPPPAGNISGNPNLTCCDYYTPRVGYQFTQCKQQNQTLGGPYILPGRENPLVVFELRNNEHISSTRVPWFGLFQLIN